MSSGKIKMLFFIEYEYGTYKTRDFDLNLALRGGGEDGSGRFSFNKDKKRCKSRKTGVDVWKKDSRRKCNQQIRS